MKKKKSGQDGGGATSSSSSSSSSSAVDGDQKGALAFEMTKRQYKEKSKAEKGKSFKDNTNTIMVNNEIGKNKNGETGDQTKLKSKYWGDS